MENLKWNLLLEKEVHSGLFSNFDGMIHSQLETKGGTNEQKFKRYYRYETQN